ncbi:MAG: hypothetical protein MRY72_02635 [Aquisalinus sp.]|nr:hypothetical protein [Aquisalinus sp.]
MFKKSICLSLAAVLTTVGCSSVSEGISNRLPTRDNSEPRIQSRSVNATEAPDVQALPVTSLPPGQCGMLLWTLDEREPVLVFRAIEGQGAEMIIEGQSTQLNLTSQSGESRYGITSTQQYTALAANADINSINVDAFFGLAFENGVYVENGLITLTNNQGWERLLPVAGLTGCRK